MFAMIQYTFFQTGDHSSMSSFDVVAPHRTVSPTNTSVTTDITATRPTTKPAAQYSPDNSTISEGSDSTIAPHYEPHDASIYITSLRHEAPVLAPLRSLGTLKGMVLFIADALFFTRIYLQHCRRVKQPVICCIPDCLRRCTNTR